MNAILILIGIIILIPIARTATRNLRNILKNEKDIYLKHDKRHGNNNQ